MLEFDRASRYFLRWANLRGRVEAHYVKQKRYRVPPSALVLRELTTTYDPSGNPAAMRGVVREKHVHVVSLFLA